jgi:hypothetical protein
MATRLAPILLGVMVCTAGANLAHFEGFAVAADLDDKGEAQAKEATRLYKQGQYEEAAKLFAQLSVEHPDMPIFERNVGACFYYLKKPEPALSNLRNYLNHKKDIAPDDKAVVDRWIEEMEKLRAQSTAAPVAPVPAAARPAGPQTHVDDAPVAPAPPAQALTSPAPQPQAPAEPPAAPAVSPPVVQPPPQEPLALTGQQASRPSDGRGLRIAGLACGALGLASIGTGIYYYTRATSLSDKVTNGTPASPSDFQAGKDAETMQWVFYSIGGGAVATGLILYLLGWSAGSANVGVAPVAAPGIAGLSAHGAF